MWISRIVGSGLGLGYHFIPFYTIFFIPYCLSFLQYMILGTRFLEDAHILLLSFSSGEPSSCGYLDTLIRIKLGLRWRREQSQVRIHSGIAWVGLDTSRIVRFGSRGGGGSKSSKKACISADVVRRHNVEVAG